MEIQNKKVLIAVPSGSGYVPLLTVQSLLQLHKPCICGFVTVERQRIDKCRNYFSQQCISQWFDYLLMIDDDNPIPPDTLEKFLEDDKDIVIAPILTRNPNKDGKHDLCAYYSEEVLVKENKLRKYNFIEKFRDKGPLHRIDAGGTGCILIKRKVLEALSKKYEYIFEFGNKVVDGQRRTMSEDAEFCERAVDAWFEIWIDERVVPIHLGIKQLIQWQPGI